MLTVVDVTEAEGIVLALTTSERRAARPLTLVQSWTSGIAER
jgi:hypothetical protein